MHALRSHLATLLLLCFVRVLLPDAWILALHQHQHTTEEPAHALLVGNAAKGKLLLTAKHQHCQTDHFNHSSFQLASPLEVRFIASYLATTGSWPSATWPSAAMTIRHLRGPPHYS